jgi:hypothetical protein
MQAEPDPWCAASVYARAVGHGKLEWTVVALGAVTVVATTVDLGGCESTVERGDSSGATTSSGAQMSAASSSGDDMCSGAASIDGDGDGCPCGSDACGFCLACNPCSSSGDCGAGFTCIHADGLCGAGTSGECTALPAGDCGFLETKVCTCDKTVMAEDCAALAGADVSKDATLCSDGTFTCGDVMCKKYVEYCQVVSGGAPNAPFYSCQAASPSCPTGIADCSCVGGNMCTTDANGQVTVEILAP